MGGRVVDCARLESVYTERYRGFESPPIRQCFGELILTKAIGKKGPVLTSSAGLRLISKIGFSSSIQNAAFKLQNWPEDSLWWRIPCLFP